jgi:hypothetical protein
MNKDTRLVRIMFGVGGMIGVQCVVGGLSTIALKGFRQWPLLISIFGVLLCLALIPTLLRWRKFEQ